MQTVVNHILARRRHKYPANDGTASICNKYPSRFRLSSIDMVPYGSLRLDDIQLLECEPEAFHDQWDGMLEMLDGCLENVGRVGLLVQSLAATNSCGSLCPERTYLYALLKLASQVLKMRMKSACLSQIVVLVCYSRNQLILPLRGKSTVVKNSICSSNLGMIIARWKSAPLAVSRMS